MHTWKRSSELTRPGRYELASPAHAPLRWLTVTVQVLAPGETVSRESGVTEHVLDVLEGGVRVYRDGHLWATVVRDGMFRQGPTLICVPPGESYRLVAEQASVVVICSAPAAGTGTWAIVRPEDAPASVVGRNNWQRTIWPGTSTLPVTQRLLVGETINPPGGWSSYPPHKHDTVSPPNELPYEEVYVFRFDPPGGFGLQRIYGIDDHGAPFDVAFTVEDGDAVVIPRGYHPVVAAPGYTMAYVWVLCGEGKQYGAWTEDPAHRWVAQEHRDAAR